MPRTEEERIKHAERQRRYREKYPERVRESKKKYKNSNKGIKQQRIHGWKCNGIISDDWDKTHAQFSNITNCEGCNKEFTSTTDRCLDHDHSIKDKQNIRNVLCQRCNIIRSYVDNDYQLVMKLMSMKTTF